MYKYILDSAKEIDWMAIIPLLIFFIFFTATIIVTMRKEKQYISHMERLPLDND